VKHLNKLETCSALPLETRDDGGAGAPEGIEAAVTAVNELRAAAAGFEERIGEQLAAAMTRLDAIDARTQRPAGQQQRHEPSGETRAFGTYLRHGASAPAEELRALTVSVDPQGGSLAPPEMSTEMIRNLTHATWGGENLDADESAPAFGQVDIPAKELNTYVDVSNQLLADSGGVAEAEVRMALAEDFGKQEGLAFVKGDGAMAPEGLMTNASVAYKATGNASTLGSAPADLLITTMYALPAAYRNRGTWLMNGTTIAAVRKLKDSYGQYLWQPSLQVGQPETLLGRPLVEAIDMDDIGAAAEPILFGDIATAYRVVDRVALSILVNPFILATKGLTRIHATRRVGGAVIQAAAMVKIRCAA
jgi:predicted phage gp36 major capsid-like protein